LFSKPLVIFAVDLSSIYTRFMH